MQEHNPKQVGAYARGEAAPEPETEAVMRGLAEVTDTLLQKARGSEEDVRAVLKGSNPRLDGFAPIELFNLGQPERVVAVVGEL